jgi:hypothetical protein
MSHSREYLLELIKDLIDKQVKFIVCGGVAAVLHGVERLTVDLDLALSMSRDNLKKFLSVMKKVNMVPRAPVPAELILDKASVEAIVREKGAVVFTFIDPKNPFKQVDFFLTEDKSYDRLIDQTERIKLEDGYFLDILKIEKLIEMKSAVDPPRDKDLRDIAELKRLSKMRDEKEDEKSQ